MALMRFCGATYFCNRLEAPNKLPFGPVDSERCLRHSGYCNGLQWPVHSTLFLSTNTLILKAYGGRSLSANCSSLVVMFGPSLMGVVIASVMEIGMDVQSGTDRRRRKGTWTAHEQQQLAPRLHVQHY